MADRNVRPPFWTPRNAGPLRMFPVFLSFLTSQRLVWRPMVLFPINLLHLCAPVRLVRTEREFRLATGYGQEYGSFLAQIGLFPSGAAQSARSVLTYLYIMCMSIHMRTNIVLDDLLVREAAEVTGLRSKKALIHRALQVLIQTEHETRRRARYDQRVMELQQQTAGLALRERPHQIVRQDRSRR